MHGLDGLAPLHRNQKLIDSVRVQKRGSAQNINTCETASATTREVRMLDNQQSYQVRIQRSLSNNQNARACMGMGGGQREAEARDWKAARQHMASRAQTSAELCWEAAQ